MVKDRQGHSDQSCEEGIDRGFDAYLKYFLDVFILHFVGLLARGDNGVSMYILTNTVNAAK